MINYIVQVVLFQVLFLAVYDLFLNKETFFKWNRLYLIATPILSFIIPFLKFDSFKNTVPQEYIVMLPEAVINPQVIIEQSSNSIETTNYLLLLFISGVMLFSVLFLVKLMKLINTIIYNRVIKADSYKLVLLEEKQSAFSFFNYIFINQNLKDLKGKEIIQHELVHCKQLHSLDLLFFEFFKIVMWFNPLVYIYQKRITLLHEYISDAEVVKETDKKSYFNQLLSETFDVENILFVNQFYKQSFIKKRIAMITKNKSNKLKQLKYLVLIPLLGSMLLYSSCETEKLEIDSEIEISQPQKQITTLYRNGDREGWIETITQENESYFDKFVLFNDVEPNIDISPINFDKLSIEEKEEFENSANKFASKSKNVKVEFTLGQLESGRKIIIQRTIFTRKKLERKDYIGKENIPFAIVDESPSFEICSGTQEEVKSCFSKEIQKHVAIKFNAALAQSLGLKPGTKKIYVQFKILKGGKLEIVGARAPHPDLEVEAKRVINSLPEIKPGKFDGKVVNVTYMLPISFNVEGDADASKEYTKEKETPTSVTAEKIN
jgi:bla regulator protein BlaR1